MSLYCLQMQNVKLLYCKDVQWTMLIKAVRTSVSNLSGTPGSRGHSSRSTPIHGSLGRLLTSRSPLASDWLHWGTRHTSISPSWKVSPHWLALATHEASPHWLNSRCWGYVLQQIWATLDQVVQSLLNMWIIKVNQWWHSWLGTPSWGSIAHSLVGFGGLGGYRVAGTIENAQDFGL